MTHGLCVTTILKEREHDPYAFWQTKHFSIGLRTEPNSLKSPVTSHDLTGFNFGDRLPRDLREIQGA